MIFGFLSSEANKIRTGWRWYLLGIVIFVFFPMLNDNFQTWKLEQMEPEDFVFYRQPVDVLQDTYPVGTAPEFNFIKTYGVSGPIEGENTLVCKGFRSEPFTGKGFIPEESLGQQLSDPEKPFTFGGNLPLVPTTNCVLKSNITLCDAQYGVCNTVKVESEIFKFE